MKITFDGANFICQCSFPERHLPKTAGFYWDTPTKTWYSPHPGVAARLREYTDEAAKKEINRVLLDVSPWTGRLTHPKHLIPYKFQLDGALFCLWRNRAYLAADPGLGKTIMSALIINALRVPAVYICPPFLARDVEAKLSQWVIDASISKLGEAPQGDILIVPDSMLSKGLAKNQIEIQAKLGAILFVDEAHRFKNAEAGRTAALFGKKSDPGLVEFFERVIYLSGTPMPNRPMELYPILSRQAPETIDFMSKFDYGKYYCGGYQNDFGWDFSGATNVEELARNVVVPYSQLDPITAKSKRFMLRIRKKEVLKDLPDKIEELLLVGDDLPPTAARLDKAILKSFSPEDLMGHLAPNDHIATYRKELGIAKAPHGVTFIRSLLEDTDESVLVFVQHKDVARILSEDLSEYLPIVITGDVPPSKRFDLVKDFQQKKTRCAILNIVAGGIGFDLTAATRVVFVEFSWVPADNDQASDRAHRIGQKDSVFVQYMVFKNSIDRAVMESVLRKRKNTQHI